MKGKKRNAKEVKKVLSEQGKRKLVSIPHIVFSEKGCSEEKPFTSIEDLVDSLYETRI